MNSWIDSLGLKIYMILQIRLVKTTITLLVWQFRPSWSVTILTAITLVDLIFLYVDQQLNRDAGTYHWKQPGGTLTKNAVYIRIIRGTDKTMNRNEGAHQLSHVYDPIRILINPLSVGQQRGSLDQLTSSLWRWSSTRMVETVRSVSNSGFDKMNLQVMYSICKSSSVQRLSLNINTILSWKFICVGS